MTLRHTPLANRAVAALAVALGPVVAHPAVAAAAPVNPQLSITASPSTTVGLTVFAHANLQSGQSPTGTMTFRLFAPGDTGCASAAFTSTVAVSGVSVDSERFATTQAGTWRWTASYSGDANNLAASTTCGDPSSTVIVARARPYLTVSAPTPVAGAIHGLASFKGGYSPTGTLNFSLYLETPSDQFCASAPVFTSAIPVNGPGDYTSAAFTPSVPGTYRWRVSYSGDANNLALTVTACQDTANGVTVTATDSPGGRYTALVPARILDTRTGTGAPAAPVGAGSTIDLAVAGHGGVPASGAAAVALNVTVTGPTSSGYVTVYPTGTSRPTASNLNVAPGETATNLVVVTLGDGGKVSLYNSDGSAHLIADVAGWFTGPDTSATTDGRYTPLTPSRVLDTRDGSDIGHLLPGGTIDVQVAGRGGVPLSGAGAVVLNVAATDATSTGFLTVFPTGAALPLASNLNFAAGQTVSNRVMVKLGAGGKVSIYNVAGLADVIVDVSGWYSDASATAPSASYTGVLPSRVLDTRATGPLAPGTPTDVTVAGLGGVPAGASAVILNATVTEPAADGYVTIYPAGGGLPLASDLNYAQAETRPNLVVARVGAGGKVTVFTSTSTQMVFDVEGWFR